MVKRLSGASKKRNHSSDFKLDNRMILLTDAKRQTFENNSDIESMGQIGENAQSLFIDAFLQNNRLDHITQLIGFHPQYLDPFLRTQQFILKGDGPLPYDYRHFIAIMAVARHQCGYLVDQQKREFLLQNGDEKWLQGLENVPKKLHDLNDINKILAHRPWLLKKSDIEKLTKGKDNWSLSEVVHAIVILTHFHALCSFVFGCGVHANLDEVNGHSVSPDASADNGYRDRKLSSSPTAGLEGGVEELVKKMQSISQQQQQEVEMTPEEVAKRFAKVESAELPPGIDQVLAPKGSMAKLIDDPEYIYQDFTRRGEACEIPTFRIQDYSWDDHAYSLVNRLYSDVGTLLDEKFKVAYNLTYYTMGRKKNVDTSVFRFAVWNYIQCIFGIRHDDYDYREVNELLDRNLKSYIKTVCCYPNRTTKKDYDSVMKDFKHSEKIHVNLMVIEAKLQAELLYALRAIMQYMT